MNYHDYLKSARWQMKRARALEDADHKCALCSSRDALEVHHNTYENIGDEKTHDLVVLCRRCHQAHHYALPKPPRDEEVDPEAFRRLGKAWARSLPPCPAVQEAQRRRHAFLYDIMREDDKLSLRIASMEELAEEGDEQAGADLVAMKGDLEETVRRLKGDAA